MPETRRELYRSPNGDVWFLCKNEKDQAFVLHEANRAAGGAATHIDIGTFLARNGQGPEHQQLLRLIGTLVGAKARLPETP